METNLCPTYYARIYIAGDYREAMNLCREYVQRGLCVTVTPTEYIYTGGQQSGVIVELINYPRFPADKNEILKQAQGLAEVLRDRLFQRSYSIMTPETTYWSSVLDS